MCVPVNTDGTSGCGRGGRLFHGVCPDGSEGGDAGHGGGGAAVFGTGSGGGGGRQAGVTHGYVGIFVLILVLLAWKCFVASCCLGLGRGGKKAYADGKRDSAALHRVRDSARRRVVLRALRLRRRVRGVEDAHEHAVLDHVDHDSLALDLHAEDNADLHMLHASAALATSNRSSAPTLAADGHVYTARTSASDSSYYASSTDTYEFMS